MGQVIAWSGTELEFPKSHLPLWVEHPCPCSIRGCVVVDRVVLCHPGQWSPGLTKIYLLTNELSICQNWPIKDLETDFVLIPTSLKYRVQLSSNRKRGKIVSISRMLTIIWLLTHVIIHNSVSMDDLWSHFSQILKNLTIIHLIK